MLMSAKAFNTKVAARTRAVARIMETPDLIKALGDSFFRVAGSNAINPENFRL